MKISRNWLNNYIVSNKTDDELVDAFTQLGLECTSTRVNSIGSAQTIAIRSPHGWSTIIFLSNRYVPTAQEIVTIALEVINKAIIVAIMPVQIVTSFIYIA